MSDLSDNQIHIKKIYATEYTYLASMFQDWSQQDILSVLEECNGDAQLASLRISDGQAQQWSTGPKKKEKKPKQQFSTNESDNLKPERGEYSARSGRGTSSTRGARVGSARGRGRGGMSLGSNSISTSDPSHPSNAPQSTPQSTNDDTWATPQDSWDAPAANTTDATDSWDTPSVVQKSDDWATDDFAKENSFVAPVKVAPSKAIVKPISKPVVPNVPKAAPSSWAALVKRSEEVVVPVIPIEVKKEITVQKSPAFKSNDHHFEDRKEIDNHFDELRKVSTSVHASPAKSFSRASSPDKRSTQANASPAISTKEPVNVQFNAGPPGLKQKIVVQKTPITAPLANASANLDMRFGGLSIGQEETKSPVIIPAIVEQSQEERNQQHQIQMLQAAQMNSQMQSGFGNAPNDYSNMYSQDQARQMHQMGYYQDPRFVNEVPSTTTGSNPTATSSVTQGQSATPAAGLSASQQQQQQQLLQQQHMNQQQQQHQMNYGGYYPSYPGYYNGYAPQNYGQQQQFMANNGKGPYANAPSATGATQSSTTSAPGMNPAQAKTATPQQHPGFQGYASHGFNNEDPRLNQDFKNHQSPAFMGNAYQNFAQGQQNANQSAPKPQSAQPSNAAAQRPNQARPTGSFEKYVNPTGSTGSATAPHSQMNYAQMNGYQMNQQQQYGFNPMMHQGYQQGHQGQFYAGGQQQQPQAQQPQHPRSQQQHGSSNSAQQQSHQGQNWGNEN